MEKTQLETLVFKVPAIPGTFETIEVQGKVDQDGETFDAEDDEADFWGVYLRLTEDAHGFKLLHHLADFQVKGDAEAFRTWLLVFAKSYRPLTPGIDFERHGSALMELFGELNAINGRKKLAEVVEYYHNFLKRSAAVMTCDGTRRAYHWTAKSWYGKTSDSKDTISFGMYHPDGSTIGDLSMVWSKINNVETPQLRVFDDSWKVLNMFPDLLAELANVDGDDITQEEFVDILKRCGFEDITAYKSPYGDNSRTPAPIKPLMLSELSEGDAFMDLDGDFIPYGPVRVLYDRDVEGGFFCPPASTPADAMREARNVEENYLSTNSFVIKAKA